MPFKPGRAMQRLGEDRTCHCGKAFYVSQAELKRRSSESCSNECALALKRRNGTQKVNKPTKFARVSGAKTPGQTSITPRGIDQLVLDDRGGAVRCPRCERIRERGVRCSCERWTPEGVAS
jgi:hypothetical protein